MRKQYIKISFSQEGIHRWKDCSFEDVSFLRDYHRHVFYFDIEMQVSHVDRDLEFIRVKRRLKELVGRLLNKPSELSCEAIADEIVTYILQEYGNRDCCVLVSEDNENGGMIKYYV